MSFYVRTVTLDPDPSSTGTPLVDFTGTEFQVADGSTRVRVILRCVGPISALISTSYAATGDTYRLMPGDKLELEFQFPTQLFGRVGPDGLWGPGVYDGRRSIVAVLAYKYDVRGYT